VQAIDLREQRRTDGVAEFGEIALKCAEFFEKFHGAADLR
jgi:hypothetical protein